MLLLELNTPTQFLILLTFILAGMVKGLLGVGLPLIAVPLLATVFDLPSAITLMVVPVMASNLVQAWHGRAHILMVRRLWLLVATMVPCTIISAQFLATIDVSTGSVVIGAIVILFSITQLIQIRLTINPRHETILTAAVGSLAGFLNGMSNIPGPVIVMYLVALRLDKDTFVGTVAALFLVASSTLYLTMAVTGMFSLDNTSASFISSIPVMAGVFLGIVLRKRINETTFKRILNIGLVVLGLHLINKGLT